MRKISTIIKSVTFITIIGFYVFSANSFAGGTCEIGYVKQLILGKDISTRWANNTMLIATDNTGFVTPSQGDTRQVLHDEPVTAIWFYRSVDKFNYTLDLLKMAQAARMAVRIYTPDDDCRGGPDDFSIYVCTYDQDCNRQ